MIVLLARLCRPFTPGSRLCSGVIGGLGRWWRWAGSRHRYLAQHDPRYVCLLRAAARAVVVALLRRPGAGQRLLRVAELARSLADLADGGDGEGTGGCGPDQLPLF